MRRFRRQGLLQNLRPEAPPVPVLGEQIVIGDNCAIGVTPREEIPDGLEPRVCE
jgi:hypothetical protein